MSFAGLFSRPGRKVRRVGAPAGAVRRDGRSLVERRGWVARGGGYSGPYAPKNLGTWHGRIERAGESFRVYIRRPPTAMQSHPKWVCFHQLDDDWWRIHLNTPPVDRRIDPIIQYVERLLTEALQGRGS